MELNELQYSREWVRLLHYQKNFWGGYRSSADGEKFFLDPEGKTNPGAELLTSIKLFKKKYSGKDPNLNPQCRFPLRFRFVKKHFLKGVRAVPCPDLDSWVKKISPMGVGLVFSDSYPYNPGSVFGAYSSKNSLQR